MDGDTIAALATKDVDRLRPLWIGLHHRHHEVSPVPLVADDEHAASSMPVTAVRSTCGARLRMPVS